MDQVTTAAAERPLWRRIVDFPLVAMLIGVAVIMLGFMAAGIIVTYVIPKTPGLGFEMKIYLVSVLILVALYVFVIAKLGEHKRNDLRDPKWLRHLLLGLIGGTVIFSIAVAIAGAALPADNDVADADRAGVADAGVTDAVGTSAGVAVTAVEGGVAGGRLTAWG